MPALFIIAAAVAVAATLLAVTSRVILHALLYLALSLIAVAVSFFIMGAPFVAALEVIIYAGAIVVLFLFAVMLLMPRRKEQDMGGGGAAWIGPVILALVLLAEVVAVVAAAPSARLGTASVSAREVGRALFGPYAIGVEIASMLLLVALVGARHLAGRLDFEHEEPSSPEDRAENTTRGADERGPVGAEAESRLRRPTASSGET